MKKVLMVMFIFVIYLSLTSPAIAVEGASLDGRLKRLLNDETDPFFPDSIRWDFLAIGMKKCATLCDQVGNFRMEHYVGDSARLATGEAFKVPPFDISSIFSSGTPITKITNIWLKDTTYALVEIKAKDVAQKKIATSEPIRYWYKQYSPGATVRLGVYPAPIESTAIWIFGSCAPLWADTSYLNPGFENEVVLYALYLCKQRQGEHEVANFIKQIAINEILDLKAILENRPVDVTIAKEVVPR